MFHLNRFVHNYICFATPLGSGSLDGQPSRTIREIDMTNLLVIYGSQVLTEKNSIFYVFIREENVPLTMYR